MKRVAKLTNSRVAENTGITFSMLLFAAFIGLRFFAVFSPSSDLAGVESNVVYSILRILDSGKLYTDPSNLPFSITQYTPIYYYVCSVTANALLPHPSTDIHQIYIIGRSWNLLFNLLTGYGVYKICYNLFKLPLRSCLIAAMASFIFTFPHNFVVRPDSLHDTFAIWAIYFFSRSLARGEKVKTTLLLLAAILLSTAALYTKQSGMQLIFIFLAHHFLTANWKMFAATLLISIILVGGPLLLFITCYSSFLENVWGGVTNGLDMHDFFDYIVGRKLFLLQLFPFFLAALYISFKQSLLFKGSAAERFLCLSALATFVFATLTSLKKGSNLQYYIVFTNITLILIFFYLDKLKAAAKAVIPVTYFSLNAMMIAFTIFAYQTVVIQHGSAFFRSREQAADKVADYVRTDLALKPGEYVFANLSTDYSVPPRGNINNILSANCVAPQLDIPNFSTGPLKVFGYKNFYRALVTGEIKYIISSYPANRFEIIKGLQQVQEENYRLLRRIDGYLVYKFTGNKSLTE